ncbi:MAG: FitA-like ribbon-helix-helix domain-containing protein [Anaerolineae bacterium]|jgi:predicted transcriptional regulator
MASITLKNNPDDLHNRLAEIARRNHRSLFRELIVALEANVR